MIKKSITNILINLILINSIGCNSYKKHSLESDSEIIRLEKKVEVNTLNGKEHILTSVEIVDLELRGKCTYNKEKVVFFAEEIKTIEVNEYDALFSISTLLNCGVIVNNVKVITLEGKEYYFTKVEVNGLHINGKVKNREILINANEIKEFQVYEKNILLYFGAIPFLIGVGLGIYTFFTIDVM